MDVRAKMQAMDPGEHARYETALIKRCPQFKTCSAPECPLDPLYDYRGRRQEDEDKCRAQKPTRLRIVEQARAEGVPTAEAIRYDGLTRKEFAGREAGKLAKARFDALPEAEKEAVRSRLAGARESRGST